MCLAACTKLLLQQVLTGSKLKRPNICLVNILKIFESKIKWILNRIESSFHQIFILPFNKLPHHVSHYHGSGFAVR